jgi:signal transduction histidine kinase
MPNILIVDDDEGDRKLVRRALEKAGLSFACVETDTVEGALTACDYQKFDCAIVDYRMPGVDGLQGIAALHERSPYTAIIMATGQGDETVAAAAMKHGASDYIPKKLIDAKTISRSVIYAIDKKRDMVAQEHEELENFARVLAHDLRSPIASLQLFAKAMAEELSLPTIDKDEVLDQCQEIFVAAERIGALIDALSAWTRADAQIAFETVDMNQAVDNAIADLKKTIQERRAQVTRGELPTVVGNSPLLTQLLQNLIANAIKFCKAASPRVHIAARPHHDKIWLFSVKDNGIGIDAKDLPRLFHPFTRLRRAGEFEGTGLGLATCKKIVERHGGAIRCESAPGEGATFFFTLAGAHPQPH